MSRKRKSTTNTNAFTPRIIGMLLMLGLCIIALIFGLSFLRSIKNEEDQGKRGNQTPKIQVDNTQNHGAKADSAAQAQSTSRREDFAFYRTLPGEKPTAIGQVTPPIKNTGEGPVTGANYRIQVGAFREREQADRMRARMILRDYPVVITQSGRFFLVQIGPYQQKETAQRIQQRLKREGVDTLLKSYVN